MNWLRKLFSTPRMVLISEDNWNKTLQERSMYFVHTMVLLDKIDAIRYCLEEEDHEEAKEIAYNVATQIGRCTYNERGT